MRFWRLLQRPLPFRYTAVISFVAAIVAFAITLMARHYGYFDYFQIPRDSLWIAYALLIAVVYILVDTLLHAVVAHYLGSSSNFWRLLQRPLPFRYTAVISFVAAIVAFAITLMARHYGYFDYFQIPRDSLWIAYALLIAVVYILVDTLLHAIVAHYLESSI